MVVKEKLSRDITLLSAVSINMGVMIGSAIFVLPGVAASMAGPAVVISFIIAGGIAGITALSMSELSTAMPVAGGAYVYVTRSMGPLIGSIVGWGLWLSLLLKGAFALAGMGIYLGTMISIDKAHIKSIALFMCLALLLINIIGTKTTGEFQKIIFLFTLAILGIFISLGVGSVNLSRFENFAPFGAIGVLEASALIFVSYVGITKIAAISEEIKDPGKNIPRSMFISLFVISVLYILIMFVVLGVCPTEILFNSHTPILDTAEYFMGGIGGLLITSAATIALISMANAAVITSSRYPFAMGRDQLMPKFLLSINRKFSTPVNSILITCTFMIFLILFFDVINLAKLASTFTMFMFSLINASLIIFRYTHPPWYKPVFKSPGYPYIPLLGVILPFVLISLLGELALFSVLFFIMIGIAWFFFYGRKRVSFKGAFEDALIYMRKMKLKHLASTKIDEAMIKVLVPLSKMKHEKDLLVLADWLTDGRERMFQVAHIKEVPIQTPLHVVKKYIKGIETKFERMTKEISEKLNLPVETYEVLTHNWRHAVINCAEERKSDLILLDWDEEFHKEIIHGSDIHWVMLHAPCDVAVFKDRGLKIKKVLLITTSDVYDNLKIRIINSMSKKRKLRVTYLHVLDEKTSPLHMRTVKNYHKMLRDACICQSESIFITKKNALEKIIELSNEHDLIIMSVYTEPLKERIFGHIEDRILEKVSCSVLLIQKSKIMRKSRILENDE